MAGLTIEILRTWGAVNAAEWDALVGEGSPFLEYTYLRGLEESGCAVPDTGWDPRPVLVRDGAGRLVGGAPAWIKAHSMGEFVYDFGWAQAAERAGIPYYPKLVVGVPFGPVTGDRLIARDPLVREALFAGLTEVAKAARGLHVLFPTAEQAEWLATKGLFPRVQYQFHWRNAGYRTFEEFLARFSSKDRNKLRHERKEAARLRFDAFTGPDRATIDVLYDFYADTTDRHMWGQRYLTRDLFRWLADRWGHRLHVVLAKDQGAIVGGALNITKGDRLYGRYWGCRGARPFLHFEVCYHQGVEWCIRHGLAAFEPGHGGDHKYKRGFMPEITWSAHQLAHAGLHRGVRDWTQRESAAVHAEVARLHANGPLKPAPRGDGSIVT